MNQRVGKFFNLNKKKATYKYIGWILNSKFARNYFKSLGTGGVQINISKKQILSIKIPIPELDIQKQIVDDLEGFQGGVKELISKINDKNKRIERYIDEIWGI